MSKVLKILTLPKHKKELRLKSTAISLEKISSEEFKRLVANMIRTMQVKDGIGLAAPQIGKAIRAVVINTKEGPLCMINPLLTKKSLTSEIAEEGCLSVPNVFGQVKRHRSLCCEYLDLNGIKQKLEAKGLMARAVQHELDHLDGVLFIDKIEPKK